MRKFIDIVRTGTIAFWPILFLALTGIIDKKIRILVTHSFNPAYNFLLASFYILSGAIFAFNSLCSNEYFNRKSVLGAHIVSASLVMMFSASWVLYVCGTQLLSRVRYFYYSTIGIGVLSFVLGYTVYSAIKAGVLYRK